MARPTTLHAMAITAPSSPPFFSVVVPVLNGGPTFASCLEALGRSTFRDWELIVVDDGSEDGSARLAAAAGAALVRTSGRVGPGGARNQGAARAAGEYLFFIDADCEVSPETLERAARVLRSEPGLDALFGSYDDEPAAPGLVSQYKNLQHHFVHQTGRVEASTFWAGCGVMKRATFLALGGFDVARYRRPSIEDIELGYRLRAAGGRIRLAKDVQVKHHKVWTLPGLIKTDVFDRGVPWTELLVVDRNIVHDLNLETKGRASVVLAVALCISLVLAFFQPPFAWAAAGSAALLLVLNIDLYRFFYRKRGLRFALISIPLHWLYHGYCAVAFALGHLRALRVRLGEGDHRSESAVDEGTPVIRAGPGSAEQGGEP